MNWGKSIVLAFILFAGYIGFLVVVTLKEDFYLVSEDYYKKEIEYQQQIQRESNFNQLSVKPSLVFEPASKLLMISFPTTIEPDKEGIIHLFRPSDAKIDKIFSLDLKENQQNISLQGMTKGLWKVKFNWTLLGKEFYQEKTIVI